MTYPPPYFSGVAISNNNISSSSSSSPALPLLAPSNSTSTSSGLPPLSTPRRGPPPPPPTRPATRPPSLYPLLPSSPQPPHKIISHVRSSSVPTTTSSSSDYLPSFTSSSSVRGTRTSGVTFNGSSTSTSTSTSSDRPWCLLQPPPLNSNSNSPPSSPNSSSSSSSSHLSFISSEPRVFVDTLKKFLVAQSSSQPPSGSSGSPSASYEYNPYSNLPPPLIKKLTIWPSAVRDALSAPLRPSSMDLLLQLPPQPQPQPHSVPRRPGSAAPGGGGRLTPSSGRSRSSSPSPFVESATTARPRSNSALGFFQSSSSQQQQHHHHHHHHHQELLTVPSTFPTPVMIGDPIRNNNNKLKRRHGRSGSRSRSGSGSGSGSGSDFDELLLLVDNTNKDWAKLRVVKRGGSGGGGGDSRERHDNERRSREYEEELFGSSSASSSVSGSPPSILSSSSSASASSSSSSTSSLLTPTAPPQQQQPPPPPPPPSTTTTRFLPTILSPRLASFMSPSSSSLSLLPTPFPLNNNNSSSNNATPTFSTPPGPGGPSPYHLPKTPSTPLLVPQPPRTPTTPRPTPPPQAQPLSHPPVVVPAPAPPAPAPAPAIHLPLFLSALHALRMQGTVEELNLVWYVDQGSESLVPPIGGGTTTTTPAAASSGVGGGGGAGKWSMGSFPMREVWACVGVGAGAGAGAAPDEDGRRRRQKGGFSGCIGSGGGGGRRLKKLSIDAQIPKVAEMLWAAVQLGEEGEREERARMRARAAAGNNEQQSSKAGGGSGVSAVGCYDRPPLIPSLEELHLTLRTDSSSNGSSSSSSSSLMPLLALIITLVNRLGGASPTFTTPISVLKGKGTNGLASVNVTNSSGSGSGLRVLTIRTIGHVDLGFLGLLGKFPNLRKLELYVPLDARHFGAPNDNNNNNNNGNGEKGAEVMRRLIGNHRELRELSVRYSRCCWDPARDGFCLDGQTHAMFSGLVLPCLQTLEVGLHLPPCGIMLRALSHLQLVVGPPSSLSSLWKQQQSLSTLTTLILKDRSLTLEETRVVLRAFANNNNNKGGGGLRRLSMYAKKLSPQLIDVVAWSCPMLSVWEVDVQMAVKSEDGEEVDDVAGFCSSVQKHGINYADDEWRYRTWTLSDISVLKWEFQVGHGYSVGCMTAIAKVVPSVRSFAGRAAVWAREP